MKRKTETLEDVIRMAARVQARLREEGIGLSWTMQFAPLPKPAKRDARRKGK